VRRSGTGFGPKDDENNQAAAADEDHVLSQSMSCVGHSRSTVAPPPSHRRSFADDNDISSTGCHSERDAAMFLRFSAHAAS
jgi:hypothetical protein